MNSWWSKKTAEYTTLVLVLCLFTYFFLNVQDLTDDAYIFLRYAKNFVEGHGLVFNVGERVEGYSSFLWVILVSALMKSGADPVLSVRILGFVFGAGIIVMLFALSKRVFGEDVPVIFHSVPAALLVSYRFFDYWCAQGLENPLYIFLLLCGMYCYLSEYAGIRRFLAPAIFGLLALTRPEGLAFFGITFLHRAVLSRRGGRPLKDDLMWTLPFLAVFLPFIAWRIYYYGYPLPNTYYAKTSDSMMQITEGWRYIKNSVSSLGVLKYPLVALPFIPLFAKSRPRGYLYIATVTAAGFFFILTSGGDIQTLYRFFLLHGAPLLIFMFYVSAAWIYLSVRPAKGVAAGVVSLLLIFSLCGYGLAAMTGNFDKHDKEVEGWATIGKWIKKNTRPGAVIAVSTAGAIPYFSERTAIDMVGLNDAYIAHHPEYTIGETPQEKKYNTRYVLSRKPNIIIFRAGEWPRANCELDLFNSPGFRENYMPFNVGFGQGVATLYVRLQRPVVGAEAGRGYIKGLGEFWGYRVSHAYDNTEPEYLDDSNYLARLNPNMANHYYNAVFCERTGQLDLALKELEMEKRQNPRLLQIYGLGTLVAGEKGDQEERDKWAREYDYYANLNSSEK